MAFTIVTDSVDLSCEKPSLTVIPMVLKFFKYFELDLFQKYVMFQLMITEIATMFLLRPSICLVL